MGIYVDLQLSEVSQSVSSNTSSVKGEITLSWTSGSWDHNNRTSSITINGVKYSFINPNINPSRTTSGSQSLYVKTVLVEHNSDGSKTVYASCSVATGTSSGTVTDSTSKVLDIIPRTSTINVSDFTIESGVSPVVTKMSSSFVDRLDIKLNDFTIKTINDYETQRVVFSNGELEGILEALKDTLGTIFKFTFIVTTKSGSTTVGSDSDTAWGALSGSVNIGVGGEIKKGIPYVSSGGEKKRGILFIGVDGEVKQGNSL